MDQATGVAALSPLAQAGLAGIALAAIIVILLIVREHRRDMKDVIKGNTDAMLKNAEAIAGLKESLPHVCRYNR